MSKRLSAIAPARRRILTAPLIALAASAAIALPATAAERPLAEEPVPVIRVSGEGEVRLAPDIAILSLSVLREARTAREALDANNAAMTAIIEALKADGIAARDLQTSGFSIQPRYSQVKSSVSNQDEPRIIGYAVSNQLSVKIRDLSKTGAILDKVVTLGVNSGGNIVFGNDDPRAAISQAREAAVRDAINRAKTLAAAAGVELGPILEISDNYAPPRPMPMARGRNFETAMMADAVPVEAGENVYTVTVQATWQIAR